MVIIQLSDPIKVAELGTLDPESGVGHFPTVSIPTPGPEYPAHVLVIRMSALAPPNAWRPDASVPVSSEES